jgi:hypothetical protein
MPRKPSTAKKAPAKKKATPAPEAPSAPTGTPGINAATLLKADMDARETACKKAVEAALEKYNCSVIPLIQIEGNRVGGEVQIRANSPQV